MAAAAETQNIYDVLGTVLYRTIPVSLAADTQVPPDPDDARNVPLDYETALRLLEAEQSPSGSGGAETSAPPTAATIGGGLGGKGGVGGGGKRMTLSATAATSLNTSFTLDVLSPPQQQLTTQAAASTRNAAIGRGRIPLSAKGASLMYAAAGTINRGTAKRVSRVVGFEDSAAVTLESVAVRNANIARLAHARSTTKTAPPPRSTLNGSAGGGATAAVVQRASERPLTVADALSTLFPLTAVPDSEGMDAEEGEVVGRNLTSTGGLSSRKASMSSSAALGVTTAGTAAAAVASSSSFPCLWRRADVGHTSRLDVVMLYLHLQRRAACEDTRPRGVVCPNRERLYNDVLLELTRQVALLCPERGLLMEELSRSMLQSIETYEVLLDSASQYAVRKSTERDLHQHLFTEKAELETEVRRREHRVSEWRAKYAGLQKRFEEQRAADEKLHEQEIAYARKANTQLVNEIKRLASEAEKSKEA